MKMNNLMMNIMISAATLLLSAGAVSAQTMKAEIPFNFTVHGKVLAAGKYELVRSVGETSLVLRAAKSHETVTSLALSDREPGRQYESTRAGFMQFVCDSGCRLQRIWTNNGYPVHEVAPRNDPAAAGAWP